MTDQKAINSMVATLRSHWNAAVAAPLNEDTARELLRGATSSFAQKHSIMRPAAFCLALSSHAQSKKVDISRAWGRRSSKQPHPAPFGGTGSGSLPTPPPPPCDGGGFTTVAKKRPRNKVSSGSAASSGVND